MIWLRLFKGFERWVSPTDLDGLIEHRKNVETVGILAPTLMQR